jgi:hypothetical protein
VDWRGAADLRDPRGVSAAEKRQRLRGVVEFENASAERAADQRRD